MKNDSLPPAVPDGQLPTPPEPPHPDTVPAPPPPPGRENPAPAPEPHAEEPAAPSEELSPAPEPRVEEPATPAEEPAPDPEPRTEEPASASAAIENEPLVSAPRAAEPEEPVKETPPPHEAPAAAPRQSAPSFWKARPVLKAESPLPPSFSSRLFGLLGYMPLLPLALMLALQTIFSLDARELWYSDEIRHADAFRNFLEHPGFVLTMDGEFYPDKPPLYFAFLWGVHAVLDHFSLLRPEGVTVHFAGAALSAFFFLLTTMLLGRMVARLDGRSLLAGGIVLLSSGLMIGLVHYARMDLLFATFIVLSQIAFYHAVVRRRSFSLMGCAFFLAGVACLTKGPYGVVLPLLAALVFSCWRGTPARLFRLDALAGLLVFLAVVGVWAGGVYLETGGADYLVSTVLKHQIVDRALNASHHQEPWHYYLVRLPLVFLPWTLAVLSIRWHRLFSRDTGAALARSRQPEGEGLAFLWITVITTFLVLSAVSTKIHVYFLPALPALALLTGRALLRLTGVQAGMLRHTFAVFFLLAGTGIVLFSLMLFGFMPVPDAAILPKWQVPMNGSFFFVAMILVALAATLWFGLRGNRPEGVLLTVALFTTALAFPLANMAAPSFNAVLSPKAQALVMKDFIEAGYKPLSFKVYGGTYSYFSGSPTTSIASLREAQDLVDAHVPFVLALRAKDLAAWVEKPQALHEVHRQWIETNEYILLAFPVSEAKGPVRKAPPGADDGGQGLPGGAPVEAPAGAARDETPEEVPPAVNGTGTMMPAGNATLPATNGAVMPEQAGSGASPEQEAATVVQPAPPAETPAAPEEVSVPVPDVPGTPDTPSVPVREALPDAPEVPVARNGTVPQAQTPVNGAANPEAE